MTQIGYILALHRRLNLTKPRYQKLAAFFAEDWQKAYTAKLTDWQAAGVEPRALEKFFSSKETRSPSEEQALLQTCGARILQLKDAAYPSLWHNIAQAPAIALYKGNVDNLSTKSLAVVGSRKMTDYGVRTLQKILGPVFEKKVTVVSGLAFGVDAAAHKLALAHGAPTVAVLGNGIDVVYPKANAGLAAEILATGGTIVSEYLPQTEAHPKYFPQRNRLVVGLAQATVVVEGAIKSGSLISARLANDFGRDVWAVPGDVFRTNSAGCNLLISQGEAAPLLRPDQLLETLNLKTAIPLQQLDLSPEELEIVKVLGSKNTWELEDFLAQFQVPASALNSRLTMLELKGVVQRRGNNLFLG